MDIRILHGADEVDRLAKEIYIACLSNPNKDVSFKEAIKIAERVYIQSSDYIRSINNA